MSDAQAQLRQQTRAALAEAGLSQAEASRRLGVSTKHLSHMLTGRAPLTLDWAEKLLALCDQRLLVAAVAETASPPGPRQSLDDLTSDQLDTLYAERDDYRADCQKWADCVTTAEKIRQAQARDADQYEAQLRDRITELTAEVARLTAGQCTHARAMCDLHHTAPVDGCPYPKCKTARTATA